MRRVQPVYKFLKECPICNKEYNEHWKVVNHIRKNKEVSHQKFLKIQEDEVVFFYKSNDKDRYYIKYELYKNKNIFAGLDYGKIMNIIEKYIHPDELEQIRRKRISQTMKTLVKTSIHNKNVSDSVKKAWKDGKYDTEEYRRATKEGLKKRDFSGKNNPMYGKPSPKGAGRGKGGIRKDIGHYVRSTWEANMCRICNYMNRDYKFEPDKFKVVVDGDDLTYTPDFYFLDKKFYYELKGHAKSSKDWTCICKSCVKNRKKIDAARQKYGVKIIIIGHDEYKKFKRRFRKFIPHWEK